MAFTTKKFGTENDILIASEHNLRVGCIVNNTGVEADENGEKWLRAGTPVGSETSVLENRQTPLSKVADATVQGILLHDVDVTKGAANGEIVIRGWIDTLKIDSTTRALLTSTITDALPGIVFMKGREN